MGGGKSFDIIIAEDDSDVALLITEMLKDEGYNYIWAQDGQEALEIIEKQMPKLLITDSQINNVCRDYYSNPNFGHKDNTISMFDFHNLLTEANKSSYIDSYVQRGVNATEINLRILDLLHLRNIHGSWVNSHKFH